MVILILFVMLVLVLTFFVAIDVYVDVGGNGYVDVHGDVGFVFDGDADVGCDVVFWCCRRCCD